jgi:maltose/moltooligosaccharide transporter
MPPSPDLEPVTSTPSAAQAQEVVSPEHLKSDAKKSDAKKSDAKKSDKKMWHAGTLSYTTAGLVGLFSLLLLGDFAWSLKERSVGDVFKAVLKEYSSNATLLASLTGALPALITMTIGPMIGGWSDGYRSRYGRRVPFLAATAPIIGLSMIGLAYCEAIGDLLNRLLGGAADERGVAVIVTMAVFWTIFEVSTIIGNAIFIALINDTVPRQVIGRFFGVFRIFSLAVGAGFFWCFFDNGLLSIFRPLLLCIAGAYVVGFLLLCYLVREGTYPEPLPKVKLPVGTRIHSYVRSIFTVRFFTLLFIVWGVASISFMPININSFNAKDQFQVDKSGYGQALAITYIISMCLAYPLGWLSDRFHPLRMGLITLALYAMVMFSAWFLVTDPRSFTVFFIAHGVLSGSFFTSTAAMLLLLLPRAHFSAYAAASAALTAVMTMTVSLSLGGILDLSGRDFRIIFLIGALLSATAVLGWLWLIRDFNRLGGIKTYVPPGTSANDVDMPAAVSH